jgi:hypothetical protein
MSTRYHVRADWDPKAKVWVSSSNIPGLVVEAATLPEFIELVQARAPDLLRDNAGIVGRVPFEWMASGELDLAHAS